MKKKNPANRTDEVLIFCKKVVDIIQKENGPSDYKIKVIYQEDIRSPRGSTHSKDILALINIDIEYIRATVTITPMFIEMYYQGERAELIEALCHEISHIKFSKIDELAGDRWGTPDAIYSEIEKLTELNGRMLYKILNFENKFKGLDTGHGITKRRTK